MSVMSDRHLDEQERRAAVIAAGGWPDDGPQQEAEPDHSESAFYCEGRFFRSLDDADLARRRVAERRARDDERRRAYFAARPELLDEIRERLDAVAAQEWAEMEAA